MKKIHYDKFANGSICCGTQCADYATRDVSQVTCRKCLENSDLRLDELPTWIVSKGIDLLFGSSSDAPPPAPPPESHRRGGFRVIDGGKK